jgi:hypothetical protein
VGAGSGGAAYDPHGPIHTRIGAGNDTPLDGESIADYIKRSGRVDHVEFDDQLEGSRFVNTDPMHFDYHNSVGGVSKVFVTDAQTPDGEVVKTFVKPASGLKTHPLHRDIPAGQDLERERAALLVNRAMGDLVTTPTQVINPDSNEHGLVYGLGKHGVQIGAPGKTPDSMMYGLGPKPGHAVLHEGNVEGIPAHEYANMALFDVIIGNHDRHHGNYLIDTDRDRLIPIDHGLSLPTRNANLAQPQSMYNQDGVRLTEFLGARTLSPRQQIALEQLVKNRPKIDAELTRLGLGDTTGPMWERVFAIQHHGQLPTAAEQRTGEYISRYWEERRALLGVATVPKSWHSGYQVKYSANQPRHPGGSPQGGQFASAHSQNRQWQVGAALSGVGGGGVSAENVGPMPAGAVIGLGVDAFPLDEGETIAARMDFDHTLDHNEFDARLTGGFHDSDTIEARMRENVGGVSNVYKVDTITADGDKLAVYVKPQSGLKKSAIHADIPAGQDLERERAAVLINRALGGLVETPTMVIVPDDDYLGKHGVQIAAPGRPIVHYANGQAQSLSMTEIHATQAGGYRFRSQVVSGIPDEQYANLGLFDAIIGNYDRHAGNVLADSDRMQIIAIDHGLSMPEFNRRNSAVNQRSLDAAEALGRSRLSSEQRQAVGNLLASRPQLDRELTKLGLSQNAITALWQRVDHIQAADAIPSAYDQRRGIIPDDLQARRNESQW